ncbi:UPF0183 protein, partial [Mucuna pruriens]
MLRRRCCEGTTIGTIALDLHLGIRIGFISLRKPISEASYGKKVGVGSLMNKASAPPLPSSNIYMEEAQVKLGVELTFTIGSQHIPLDLVLLTWSSKFILVAMARDLPCQGRSMGEGSRHWRFCLGTSDKPGIERWNQTG